MGCHANPRLVLTGELVCTVCLNWKGSHKTKWTAVFGITLVLIHSVLTQAFKCWHGKRILPGNIRYLMKKVFLLCVELLLRRVMQ